MLRTFRHRTSGALWKIHVEDDTITITRAGAGQPEETEVIQDSFGERGLPPDVLFNELIGELDPEYEEVMPENLLELVEEGHGVALSGRLRAFYADREYVRYQGMRSATLDCRVNFIADVVLGNFYEEFYDAAAGRNINLLPISSKLVGDDYDYEDEQQWIGVDPSLPDGPVYALYTSNAYEHAFDNLDAFLADLRPD